MKVKNLYKGVFNFPVEIIREYAMAYSAEQAKVIMARRIAKKQNISPIIILAWMKENSGIYKIALEMEWEEE